MGSSRTGPRTRVPCIGRRTLNHCATREAPRRLFLIEGAASAKALRLEQVGLFDEQKEGWCGWNIVSEVEWEGGVLGDHSMELLQQVGVKSSAQKAIYLKLKPYSSAIHTRLNFGS